jgi:hypothetical protein
VEYREPGYLSVLPCQPCNSTVLTQWRPSETKLPAGAALCVTCGKGGTVIKCVVLHLNNSFHLPLQHFLLLNWTLIFRLSMITITQPPHLSLCLVNHIFSESRRVRQTIYKFHDNIISKQQWAFWYFDHWMIQFLKREIPWKTISFHSLSHSYRILSSLLDS